MLKDKRILIIAPHPDDEVIGSGGLIMLARKQKARVFVLYMAIGKSRQFLTGQTTAHERIPEIGEASRYGDFEYSIAFNGMEFMRLDMIPQKDLIEKIEDVNKQFMPDIVVLPFRNSFDQDHRATAQAGITAFRPLPKELNHQPKIILEVEEPYIWSSQEFFGPNFYVDISEVMTEKINLLQCHKTQIRRDPFPRSPANLYRLAGLRGCEISTQYAEGYNLIKGQL